MTFLRNLIFGLIFIMGILIGITLYSQPAMSAEPADLGFAKVFQGEKYGTVTFDHLSHLKQDCVGCHTEKQAAGGVTKDLGHKFCKVCHKASENAPTKCKGCHIK